MSRKAALKIQSTVATAIRYAAQRSSSTANRLASEIDDVTKRQEKEHRAMGARWTGGKARYESLGAAVNHFLCVVVWQGMTKYQDAPIGTLFGMRQDYILGAILASDTEFRENLVKELSERFPGRDPVSVLAEAGDSDYAAIIAHND